MTGVVTRLRDERPAGDGQVVRISSLGPRSYLREIVTTNEDERVIEARPISRRQAEAETGRTLAPGAGCGDTVTTCRALLRLLVAYPNASVTVADVSCELGRQASRQAVHQAAQRLRRDLPIESIHSPRGGYVLLQPISAYGTDSCESCSCYRRDFCRLLRRYVGRRQWCWGWSEVVGL